MYIISEVRAEGPEVGNQFIRKTWKEAVEIAVRLVTEQCDPDKNKEGIEKEIEETGLYYGDNGEWSVCIGTIRYY